MPEPLIHNLNQSKAKNTDMANMILVIAIALALGFGAGFGLSKILPSNTTSTANGTSTTTADGKKAAGIIDKNTFPDQAEGTLKEGGIDGEGNFHLVRKGGDSQNVYLTSTTVDLSTFIGKKVKVWGQTFSSEKAGWLMDVGYIEAQ